MEKLLDYIAILNAHSKRPKNIGIVAGSVTEKRVWYLMDVNTGVVIQNFDASPKRTMELADKCIETLRLANEPE